MSPLAFDLATIGVLWRRDVKRQWRQPGRLLAGIAYPALLWALVGWGLSATFRLTDPPGTYLQFLFPGVLVLALAVAATLSVAAAVQERHAGFLQGVLTGPGSRVSLVLGKSAGSATVAVVQAAALLTVLPLAGFDISVVSWAVLAGAVAAAAVSFSALALALAWSSDSLLRYHKAAVLLLLPLWLASGAVFPAAPAPPALALIVRLNPVSYAVAAIRQALHGGAEGGGVALGGSMLIDLGVVVVFAVAAVVLAAVMASRRQP